MKEVRVFSNKSVWRAALVVFAFCLATAVPFYFSAQTQAQIGTSTVQTFYLAPLNGAPINNMMPRGSGRYVVDSNNNRVFETEVSYVNLPAGTILNVFVDGNPVGTMRLSTYKNAMFRLTTMMGQTVPTINVGSTMSVRSNGQTLLNGTFGPPPTPMPSPSMSPMPTPSAAFYAPLAGDTINGVMPRGMAQYAEFGTTSRRLGVWLDHIALPQGTQLGVFIDGNSVGNITLDQYGRGGIRLDSANGQTVPTIIAGSTAAIKNGSTTILNGTFRAPNPMPSPSPTMSPRPSPRPNRFFGGWMNGAQVVPPVETQARGMVQVVLNDTETQIRVYLGFIGLSGAQTTATINGPALPGANGPMIFDLGVIGGTAGRIPVRTFDVTAEQVQQLRTGVWYAVVGTADGTQIRGQIRSHTRPAGFMGTQNDDLAVFRPSDGTWYVKDGAGYSAQTLGMAGDQPVSGDYDGDGRTDYAIFRNGSWLINRSSDGGLTTRQFGIAGDIPVRGDYDGDGIADVTVFRPSTGVWYVQKSTGSGYIITQFGMNGDRPVATDLDGDGRTDIAVFRPSNGVWYWLRSTDGSFGAVQFGTSGDVPVAGDFDGDGAGDITVYRPTTGVWYIWRSSDEEFDIRQFGLSTDVTVAGNYDGDGITDIAVFRPSTGVWYIWRSSDGSYDFRNFGKSGDVPTANQ